MIQGSGAAPLWLSGVRFFVKLRQGHSNEATNDTPEFVSHDLECD